MSFCKTLIFRFRYGYIQNGHTGNYYFSQPHVMHKFTMQDVPKSAHREVATDIEIQQSHSYEIKESDFQPNYARGKQQQHHEQVYEDPVPVIVLRIPGPQKYAIHLQALLQQYLELRAAMYIQALEDEERRGHLHHPQHYVHQQQQAMQYYRQPLIASVQPQMMYHHQHHQPSPQPIMYYHQQPPQQQQHQHHHGYQQQFIQVQHVADDYHNIPAGDQSYYHHHSSVHPSVTPAGYLPTSQEHPTSYINFVTPSYDSSELQHQQPQHEESVDDDEPHISENYPSDKHTRVIFKKKNRVQPGIVYHQPEVQQPIVVADPHEEAYQHEEYNQQQQQHHHQVHQHRTKPPFNYHVAVSTLSPSHEELHERHHPKRMVQLTKEQFEKAKRMMLKRNRGSLLRPAMNSS